MIQDLLMCTWVRTAHSTNPARARPRHLLFFLVFSTTCSCFPRFSKDNESRWTEKKIPHLNQIFLFEVLTAGGISPLCHPAPLKVSFLFWSSISCLITIIGSFSYNYSESIPSQAQLYHIVFFIIYQPILF